MVPNMLSIHHIQTLLLTALLFVGCSSQLDKPTMDDATRVHPATQRFISFAYKAKTVERYDELVSEFYIPQTQQRIEKLFGWPLFVYSSPFRALKNGHCDSIELTPLENRVQIDCLGIMTVQSMILDDHDEPMHLRVYMLQHKGKWYFDRSGYVYADSDSIPVTYGRAGIKFKSTLEQ